MQIEVLKSKLHCVKVTEANLNYMGSITIDEDLMDAVGIIAGELGRPLVWNPIVQKFMHDEEANALKHYDYREGYKNLLDV